MSSDCCNLDLISVTAASSGSGAAAAALDWSTPCGAFMISVPDIGAGATLTISNQNLSTTQLQRRVMVFIFALSGGSYDQIVDQDGNQVYNIQVTGSAGVYVDAESIPAPSSGMLYINATGYTPS